MRAPNEIPHGGGAHRRRGRTGAAVAVAVAALALIVLALLPRSATASASLTVTPRTDAGADAALLLADRYATLAGSVATLRAAREADPAVADVPLDELADGTEVARVAATITVRVRLADPEVAVAAANAVVDTLVEAGASEDLVHVDRGAEATAARAQTSPDPVRWTLVVLPLALVCGLAAATLVRRDRRPSRVDHEQPPSGLLPGAGDPVYVLDDLPGFLEHPPGSPPALAAAPAPTGAVTMPAGAAEERRTPVLTRRGSAVATVLAVALLGTVSVLVAVTAGRSDDPARAVAADASASGPAATPTATPTAAPAPATAAAAAALAFESVPLGDAGIAASATFRGVVLEQRAVGLTVTYPSVSLTTDGRRSLAHVRLPTFNCLTAEPPADPVAAGCARSLTEYADLTDPDLRVSRDGERLELVGVFPTYTRPNGSPPTYTGRAYQLTATVAAEGPTHDGVAPASGVVRIGLDSAPTTGDRAVNLLQFPR